MGDARWAGPADDPDRYRLLSLLSTGGEGEVWLADRSEAGTPFRYAVKVLHPHLTDSPQVRRQMSLQTALLTQLEHPALVKVREAFAGPAPHEAGAADPDRQRLYLVMKWIDGQSLADLVAGGGASGTAGIRPLHGIGAALDYLHSGRDTGGEPVLHRDVKPQNILLTKDNRAYLVDFGLARLAETPTMSRLSGTVAFMAPESLYQGHYTAASDRYSFAATVYHALVGEAPAPGRRIQQERLRRALPARASRRLVDAVLAGLDPEPERRPATAVAIVRGLDPSAAETVDAPRRKRARKPTPPGGTPPQHGGPPPQHGGPPPQAGGPPPGPGAVPPPQARPYAPAPPPWPVYGYPYPYPYHRPFPVRRKRTWAPLIVVLVMLGVIGSCGYGVLELLKATSGTTGDNPRTGATTGARAAGPGATRRPADAGPPPPVAAALQPVLISKAEIMAIWKLPDYDVPEGDPDLDISQEVFCKGAHGQGLRSIVKNGYGNPYYGHNFNSSVAGFSGTYATSFMKQLRADAAACGWTPFDTPKLGDESIMVRVASGQFFFAIRKGRVVAAVAARVRGALTGTYQIDAVTLAKRVAARLAKVKQP